MPPTRFLRTIYERSAAIPTGTLKASALKGASRVVQARAESTTGTETTRPGGGAIDPGSINMQGIQALFAIIGAAFVVGGVWFFFWAKNGGFVWKENDWDDYKSTVLRRKTVSGETISNATKSTKLGGGSIVGRGYTDYDETTNHDTETVTTNEKPKRRGFRETAKQKLLRRQKNEEWEGGNDDDMRAYRDEKPARVGGINREADGTYHSSDYTGTSENRSEWTQSEAGHTYDYESSAGQTRTVSGYSFVAGGDDSLSRITEEQEQHEPLRQPSPARHHQGHGHGHGHGHSHSHSHARTSQRPRGPRPTASNSRQSSPRKRDRSSMPGGYTEPLDMSSTTTSEYQYEQIEPSDNGTGTVSYHHPIPGLSKGYRRGAGGRRGRRDSLSDSDGDDYDSRLS